MRSVVLLPPLTREAGYSEAKLFSEYSVPSGATNIHSREV